MKFAVFTDVHLIEYPEKIEEFRLFIRNIDATVDGYICGGDWCKYDITELEEFFKVIREETIKPVLTVFGNHDYWNKSETLNLDEVLLLQDDLCLKYNIIHLEKEVFETKDSFICGYDGWYAQNHGVNATQDYTYIPSSNSYGLSPYHFFKRKETAALYKVVDYEIPVGKRKVCVTHFGFGSIEGLTDELEEMNSEMKIVNNLTYEQKNDESTLETKSLISTGDQNRAYDPYNASRKHAIVLAEKFDLVIFGHSHKIADYHIGSCRFMNMGAHYKKSPENFYKIIEL